MSESTTTKTKLKTSSERNHFIMVNCTINVQFLAFMIMDLQRCSLFVIQTLNILIEINTMMLKCIKKIACPSIKPYEIYWIIDYERSFFTLPQ